MADSAKRKYGQGAVYGSLAYDFNNPLLYPETESEYSEPLERPAPPQTREKTAARTRTAAHARARQGISPLAIAGIFIAAALFVVGMMAQAQLLSISDSSVQLQSQLEELNTQQDKLKISYESAFNLNEIEEYATSRLGMQKPNVDQIYYVDTSSPDRAVVVQSAADETFLQKAENFFSGIGAYFK